MKPIHALIWAAFPLFGSDAFAQGQIEFTNHSIIYGIDSPFIDLSTGLRASGSDGWFAQLYVGSSTLSLLPVGIPVQFRTGDAVGYFNGGAVLVDTLPGGSFVYAQVGVWKGAGSFESSAIRATSNVLLVRLSDLSASPPETPAPLQGLVFPIPEPSSISLAMAAAGAALILRKRK